MTVHVRRDSDTCETDGGWFQARRLFSFDRYRDPEQMGVGPPRMFDDDGLRPGVVWTLHPHRDIESCTYVVEGHFGHADSLGHDGELHTGAAQVMRFSRASAYHSELNASEAEPMRFMQLWFLATGTLLQIMGPEGEYGLDLAQDARVWVSSLSPGNSVQREFADGRGGFLYVKDGAVEIGQGKLYTGGAAKIFGPEPLTIAAIDSAEIMLIDVPHEFRPVGVWVR